jgi:hypothetical protein
MVSSSTSFQQHGWADFEIDSAVRLLQSARDHHSVAIITHLPLETIHFLDRELFTRFIVQIAIYPELVDFFNSMLTTIV